MAAAERQQIDRIFGHLSNDSLIERGYRFLISTPRYGDSAMWCNAIVINRLEGRASTADEIGALTKAYINTAYVYSMQYVDFSEAYRYLHKARKIAEEAKLDDILAHVYVNLGSTLRNWMEYASYNQRRDSNLLITRAYQEKAFRLGKKSRNMKALLFSFLDLANDWFPADGRFLAVYARDFLAMEEVKPQSLYPYTAALARSILAYYDNNVDLAEKELIEMEKLLPPGYPDGAVLAKQPCVYRALIREKRGDLKGAEASLLALANDSAYTQSQTARINSRQMLYEFYTRHGQRELADRYLLEFYKIKEEIAAGGNNESVEEITLKSDIDDYRKQIAEAEHDRRTTYMVAIIVCVVAVAVIVVLFTMLVYSRRRRRYIDSLYRQTLQSLSGCGPDNEETSTTISSPLAAVDAGEECSDAPSAITDLRLFEIIDNVMQRSEVVFNPEFSLQLLSREVDSNVSYVSRAINEGYGVNFKTVLAQRRIAEACRRLSDPALNERYSIEGIAAEVGFKSRATFSVAFKTITGLTPTEFRTAARRDKVQKT